VSVGKEEILEFLAANQDIPHSYEAVYTKVFNERQTVRQRSLKRQLEMTSD